MVEVNAGVQQGILNGSNEGWSVVERTLTVSVGHSLYACNTSPSSAISVIVDKAWLIVCELNQQSLAGDFVKLGSHPMYTGLPQQQSVTTNPHTGQGLADRQLGL